jgi:hypothetical protein
MVNPDNKLQRLHLLIKAMTLQAQNETDPKRKAMITANVEKLSKVYVRERIKGGKVSQEQDN